MAELVGSFSGDFCQISSSPLIPIRALVPVLDRDPMWEYSEALLPRVVGFSETIARIPSAVVRALDAPLMFLLCRRVFRSTATGLAAAFLVALTPALFIQGRLATSQIGPIPFVLGWLLLMAMYLKSGSHRHLFAAAAILGAASTVTSPPRS